MRAWEVLVTWGDQKLAAEVLSSKTRLKLSLGNTPSDDIQTGAASRLLLELDERGLSTRMDAGVRGDVFHHGEWHPLSSLAKRGLLQEAGEQFVFALSSNDRARLQVGALSVELREAKLEPIRLSPEAAVLALFLLAVAAVSVLFASVMAPPADVHQTESSGSRPP